MFDQNGKTSWIMLLKYITYNQPWNNPINVGFLRRLIHFDPHDYWKHEYWKHEYGKHEYQKHECWNMNIENMNIENNNIENMNIENINIKNMNIENMNIRTIFKLNVRMVQFCSNIKAWKNEIHIINYENPCIYSRLLRSKTSAIRSKAFKISQSFEF